MAGIDTNKREMEKELLLLMNELDRRQSENSISKYFPDTGPLRRELYKPHMAIFKAGAWARERCVIAANGIGKTESIGSYEITCHLTGVYPEWWEGRVFSHPVEVWAVGYSNTTTKDILQKKLLGAPGRIGTGLIPKKYIDEKSIRSKPGVPDAIESVRIRNVNGGFSLLSFKSSEQGRKSFEGTEKHIIWFDEEADEFVYDECLMRTRAVNGMILYTFTPLAGLTKTVLGFMPNGKMPKDGKVNDSRFVCTATWEDAPHLTEKEKKEILDNTLSHLREARSKGVPHLGSGQIYPISEEDLKVDDFQIPVWFPQFYGLDYGWNWTAATWFAYDKDNDVLYITGCYKRGRAEPESHIKAIQARGDWIPGVADPAGGTSQKDGKRILREYQESLFSLFPADNSVEAGLLRTWKRMTTGRLLVFKSCGKWFDEFRLYRRNEKENIVKLDDHLMDATRSA